MNKRAGLILIFASITVAVIFSIVTMYRSLTGLENVLLQVFVLGLSLTGSYVFGRESAQEAAKALVKPHARSAFRRVLSLYQSLSRLAFSIQSARPKNKTDPVNLSVLDMLEAIVTEQIYTVNDAMEDWRDIVPEDIKELEAKSAARRTENKE